MTHDEHVDAPAPPDASRASATDRPTDDGRRQI
jgi:hypothetical protein